MGFPIRSRITGDFRGIEQAKRILSESLRGGLTGVGKLLVRSIRPRTRYFEGKERESIEAHVRGRGLNLALDVTSGLVQTIIDELGLPAGTFPPHRAGSRLYYWVDKRNLRAKATRAEGPRATRFKDVGKGKAPKRTPLATSDQRRTIRGAQLRAKAAREGRWFDFQSRGTTAHRVKRRSWRIEKIAYAVALKIYNKGIKPTRPLAKGLDASRNRALRELQNAITRAVARINRGG